MRRVIEVGYEKLDRRVELIDEKLKLKMKLD